MRKGSIRAALGLIACATMASLGCAAQDDAGPAGEQSEAVTAAPAPWFIQSAAETNRLKSALDAHNAEINGNPARREGAGPYAQVHAGGERVRGSVILFHGFSSRPHQMSMLATYLYDNGYNVYLPNVTGQGINPPTETWIKSTYKTNFKGRNLQKEIVDVLDRSGLGEVIRNPNKQATPGQLTKLYEVANNGLNLTISPDVRAALKAASNYDDDATFLKYMDSNHGEYLSESQERFNEMSCGAVSCNGKEPIKGQPVDPATNLPAVGKSPAPLPVYTIGLSVGASIALRLAEENPSRVAGVIAYAPLLKQLSTTTIPSPLGGIKVQERFVNAVGPLNTYLFSWGTPFSLASFTAVNRFGSEVQRNSAKMASVPTFLVSTWKEDAADNPTQDTFFRAIGGTEGAENTKVHFAYSQEQNVPHPMVHANQVSQGVKNDYWQTLYRETLRFMVRKNVKLENLKKTSAPNEATLPEAIRIPGENVTKLPAMSEAP